MAVTDLVEGALDAEFHARATNERELSGLDALELDEGDVSRGRTLWSAAWPKVAAIALALLAWQAVVWSGHWPRYVLPGPDEVLPNLWHELGKGATWSAIGTTMRRAVTGFSIALVIGTVVGLLVSRFRTLRVAVGSLITGLQTMPSVAWFPLALVLFKLSEGAIFFVAVIGAAPSIANGLITGVDHIPPILLRAGRVLGARGISRYRHVVLPAALPSFLAGLKQGWAFAWRSLMAGELLVIIANKPSIGTRLDFDRTNSDYTNMISTMLMILVIGIIVDALLFGVAERAVRRRRGLTAA